MTVFLVVFVYALEAIALVAVGDLLPLAFAVLHALLEVARVYRTILPFIHALAMRFAELIFARVDVTVREDVRAATMLQTVYPAALEAVAILPLMDAVPVGFTVLPLAQIAVTEDPAPHAVAVLDSAGPFAIVLFTVGPVVDALAMGFPAIEVALVSVAVGVALIAFALALVAVPVAFIHAVLAVDHDAEALAAPLDQLAAVDCILILLNAIDRILSYQVVIEHVRLHRVVFVDLVYIPLGLLGSVRLLARLGLPLLLDYLLNRVLVQIG